MVRKSEPCCKIKSRDLSFCVDELACLSVDKSMISLAYKLMRSVTYKPTNQQAVALVCVHTSLKL